MNLIKVASLCFALLLSAIGRTDDFDRHVADIVILQLKPVQREIGLTEAQRAKMNDAADQHRAELSQYEEELERSKGKPKSARLIKYYDELKGKVLNQLTPAQVKRLGQISLQHAGVLALGDQVVATRIGLSSAQLAAVRKAIVSDQKTIARVEKETAGPILAKYKDRKPQSAQEAQELRKKVHDEVQAAVGPKLEMIVAADSANIMKGLSPAQRKAFRDLQGKRFEIAR